MSDFVEVHLGHGRGDVSEGEHAELLPACYEVLYFFQFLKFCY